MSVFEQQIAGVVVLPPREEQLSPRQLDHGSRNVPRTTIRLRADDGGFWGVTFNGEMAGQVSLGDYIICRGYSRGLQGFVATQIWLRGALTESGELGGVGDPVLLADKRVCAVASSVFGPMSPEVALLRGFRDRTLLRSRLGRGVVACYNWLSPWLAVRVLDQSARLRKCTAVLLKCLIRCL